MINDQDYLMTQELLLNFSRTVDLLDLDAFIERAERTMSIAPVLEPTAYKEGGPLLEKIIALARAGQTVKAALNDLREDVAHVQRRRELLAHAAKMRSQGAHD